MATDAGRKGEAIHRYIYNYLGCRKPCLRLWNCGNSVEDAELRAGLKEAGIGTPATRASVIETLFSRDYMRREKKNLVPTEKGLATRISAPSTSSRPSPKERRGRDERQQLAYGGSCRPLYCVRNFGSGSAKIERQKQNYSGIYFAVQEKSSIFAPSRTCQAS